MDLPPRDAHLVLSMVPGLGPTLTQRCIQAIGSPRAVLGADTSQLAQVQGIGRQRAGEIRSAMDRFTDGQALAREKDLIQQHNVSVLTSTDMDYPRLLKFIPDPPPLLYVRGQVRDDDALALAMVGARKCTAYGRMQADRLAALSAQAGLCIISGGARGIDAAAHRAALRAGGRTIAVLGSGVANPYPPEHVDLFDEIANGYGAVVSELPMTTPPIAQNFPRRNRIISGLALGVLVIEAAARSGALITARLAVEEHTREVMALPGRADSPASAGCHKMIRQGWATLVTNVGDILDVLGETGQLLKLGLNQQNQDQDQPNPKTQFTKNLSDTQQQIYKILDQPRILDQIVTDTRLPVPTIQADLTMLEVFGLVAHQQGTYSRRHG